MSLLRFLFKKKPSKSNGPAVQAEVVERTSVQQAKTDAERSVRRRVQPNAFGLRKMVDEPVRKISSDTSFEKKDAPMHEPLRKPSSGRAFVVNDAPLWTTPSSYGFVDSGSSCPTDGGGGGGCD